MHDFETIVNEWNAEHAHELPINEKFLLTINEANLYFNIGTKKLRRIAETHVGELSVMSGNRYLIVRHKFEEYLLKNPRQ